MKATHYLVYLLLVLVPTLSSCAVDDIKASNNIVTEERILTSFSEIDVSSDMEIIIKQGAEQTVKVITSDNILKNVTTKVSNGKLTARLIGNIRKLNVIRLEITMPTITRLTLSADSFGNLSGFENLDTFRLHASSDSFIKLSGYTNSMDINASSDARIEAFNFQTKRCHVNCSSDASISITCTETLSGTVSSDAVVFYKGNPAVNVSTQNGGAVIHSN